MLVKYANFNKIQPIAPDKRAHPKASSLLVILLALSCTEWLNLPYLAISPAFLHRECPEGLLE